MDTLIDKNRSVTLPYLIVFSSDLTRPIQSVSMARLAKEGRTAASEVRKKIKEEGVDGNAPQVNQDDDADEDEEKDLTEMLTWTNTEGKKIRAAVVSADDTKVLFRMANGKEINYDISKLSQRSQDIIKERLER